MRCYRCRRHRNALLTKRLYEGFCVRLSSFRKKLSGLMQSLAVGLDYLRVKYEAMTK